MLELTYFNVDAKKNDRKSFCRSLSFRPTCIVQCLLCCEDAKWLPLLVPVRVKFCLSILFQETGGKHGLEALVSLRMASGILAKKLPYVRVNSKHLVILSPSRNRMVRKEIYVDQVRVEVYTDVKTVCSWYEDLQHGIRNVGEIDETSYDSYNHAWFIPAALMNPSRL